MQQEVRQKSEVLPDEEPVLCKVVGLDLSLRGTGICVLDPDGSVYEERVVGAKLKNDARVKDKVERMIDIATEIIAAVDRSALDGVRPRVAIENYAFAARGRQNDLAELHGVVKSQLWLGRQIEPKMVTCTSVRKAVLGRGNLKKDEIVRRLREDRGLSFSDHNAADAYVVAEYLRMKLEEEDE